MLQNDYLMAKIGVDTVENELFQVVGKSLAVVANPSGSEGHLRVEAAEEVRAGLRCVAEEVTGLVEGSVAAVAEAHCLNLSPTAFFGQCQQCRKSDPGSVLNIINYSTMIINIIV